MKKLVNTRIPAELAHSFNALSLPTIDAKNVVEVVKNRPQSNRDWREAIKRQQQPSLPQETSTAKPLSEEQQLAQADIAKAREQASLEGYSEGLEEGRKKGEQLGYQEGLAKAERERQQLADHVAAVLQGLTQPLDDQRELMPSVLANVAINIAEAVIVRELSEPNETMVTVVEAALKALPTSAKHVRIKLHPDDHACLASLDIPQWQDFQVLVDSQLKPGDCQVTSEHSIIDYSVSHRFKQAIQQLFDGMDQANLNTDYHPELTDNAEDEDVDPA